MTSGGAEMQDGQQVVEYHQLGSKRDVNGRSGGGQYQGSTVSKEDSRTLWLGDLMFWMDEAFLATTFAPLSGEVTGTKVIRNRATGQHEGYGFVEFKSFEEADRVLRTYSGKPFPGTEQNFRLNWAAFGVGKGISDDHSVFVGDLATDVSDFQLQEHFRESYSSVRNAKVITDAATGRSKGYGFVRFGDNRERDRALSEMNGKFLSSRAIRVSPATAKKQGGLNSALSGDLSGITVSAGSSGGSTLTAVTPFGSASSSSTNLSDYEPGSTNTTLFIGGLAPEVTELELQEVFGKYGTIVYTKIPPNKGCGFVQFTHRQSATAAKSALKDKPIKGSAIRICWGYKQAQKPPMPVNQVPQPYLYAPGMQHGAYFPGMYYDPSMTMYFDPYGAYYNAPQPLDAAQLYQQAMQQAFPTGHPMPMPAPMMPSAEAHRLPTTSDDVVTPPPPPTVPPPPQQQTEGPQPVVVTPPAAPGAGRRKGSRKAGRKSALNKADLKRFGNMSMIGDAQEQLMMGHMQQVQ